jgi:hypothetical protein
MTASLYTSFLRHRQHNRGKGIGYELTWEQYESKWRASGGIVDRGAGPDALCLVRIDLNGIFTEDNIQVITHKEAQRERMKHWWRSLSPEESRRRRAFLVSMVRDADHRHESWQTRDGYSD